MNLSFREQNTFARVRDAVLGDDDNLRLLQDALLKEPRKGDVIPGCGGARKIRWVDPQRGKGKRGGIRVIYWYAEEFQTILLIFAYDKNIPDLTPQQQKGIAEIIRLFEDQLKSEHNF